MMRYQDDPLIKFCHEIRKLAEDLNHNLESFKVIVSVQHTHNECFLSDIIDLNERVKALEEGTLKC